MRTLLAPLLAAALSSAGPGRAQDRAEPPAGLAPLLAQADAAYARRDEPGALEELRARLDDAQALAPDDFEVLWREARLAVWLADDPARSDEEKSRLGKRAWSFGDRAARAAPARVEGWNYAATGVGLYALGIGVLRALREGIEGKFKDRLRKAEQLDPGFSGGAIQTAWGRFWSRLPWPKRSNGKAKGALEAALRRNPDNVRAHVYLADVYREEADRERARTELRKALVHPPGRYDAPEERRMQAVARAELARLEAERQAHTPFAPGSTGAAR